MSDKLKNILSQTECPSTDIFYNYLENKLSKSDTHAFESHLNDCEFCQEALDGFQTIDKEFILASVSEINAKIDKKVSAKFSIQYIAAAATIVLGLFFGSIYMLQDSTKQSAELSVVPIEEKDLNKDELAPVQTTEPTENQMEDFKESLPKEENKSIAEPAPYILIEKEEVSEVLDDEEAIIEEDVYFGDENTMSEEMEEAEMEVEEMIVAGGSADVKNDIQSSSAAPIVTTRSNTKSIEMDDTYKEGSDKDKFQGLNEIDFKHLLSFASEQVNTSFSSETEPSSTITKKAKTYEGYSANNELNVNNNNKIEIQKQLKQVQAEQYQKALDEMNFQIMKDVWEAEESATLNWLRSICQLKLGLSAEETLKNLKRNKNPYQDEAKKLYNQLY